jgi:hypothetical protein
MKGIYFWRDLPRLSSRGLDPPLSSMQLIFFVVMALVYDNKYENSSHFFIRKCAKLSPHAHRKLLSKWFPYARCNLRLLSTRPHAKLCLVYRTPAIISRSRFEAALVYKPQILRLKNKKFPFLVHKLSAI